MIRTYTGRIVDPMNIDPRQIDPVDISHALGQLCRFNGHTSRFYSVAQHSLIVAAIIDMASVAGWHTPAEALMHDAAEAYLTDLPTPIKDLPALAEYRDAERRAMRAVRDHFYIVESKIVFPMVRAADRLALNLEAHLLMGGPEWANPTRARILTAGLATYAARPDTSIAHVRAIDDLLDGGDGRGFGNAMLDAMCAWGLAA